MERLDNLINSLKNFQSDVLPGIAEVIRANEDEILALNYDNQLFARGVNRLDKKIRPSYRPLTISIKTEKHQPTDRVTLRDTGEFHASFYIVFMSDAFMIQSDDWKAGDLANKYGSAIYGLTDENIFYVADKYVGPFVYSKLKKLTE